MVFLDHQRRPADKSAWIDRALLDRFAAEGTDAHRLCTADNGWVERFGRQILVSFRNLPVRDRLISEFYPWQKSAGFEVDRIFGRFLPKKNEEREMPRLISGKADDNLQTIATEWQLKYAIDFATGYSVGLFLDQRENRRYVRDIGPKRLLNCFAYTCSFSVCAASVGAETVNIDLSKKSLGRGRENFALNDLTVINHRFIADDVLAVLPRLARQGQKFDLIILDPPTFSRPHRGKPFHVEKEYEPLLLVALELLEDKGRILLSTNCSTMDEKHLEIMARYCLKLTRRAATFHRAPPLPDFPPGAGASTIWLTLR